MEDVISKDAEEKPKAFWSYIKSKKQESSGVAPLKNKDGFIHSDSSSKVEILNEQFVSAYTREDSSKIPTKGSRSHLSMEPIEVQSKGVHKQLMEIARDMTKKGQVDVVLLDFAKAFHKVPHQRLLHKLHFYGVRQSTLRWIESFLSKRKQSVLLDGTRS